MGSVSLASSANSVFVAVAPTFTALSDNEVTSPDLVLLVSLLRAPAIVSASVLSLVMLMSITVSLERESTSLWSLFPCNDHDVFRADRPAPVAIITMAI